MVAEAEGCLVGHYGMVPVQAVVQGQRVRGAQTVDAAVLPNYRKRGIHSSLARLTLARAVEAGITFIYAFPGLLSLEVDRRFGQEPVMFVPEMMHVLDWRRAIRGGLCHLPGDLALLLRWQRDSAAASEVGRLARLRRSMLVVAGWLSGPVWNHLNTSSDCAVRPAAHVDKRYDRLCERLMDDESLGLFKDASYLNWRYLEHPQQSYRVLEAVDSSDLLGYAVVRAGCSVSDLCELEALPGRPEALTALVTEAIWAAHGAGSVALAAWMPESRPAHRLLRRAGFVSLGRLHRLARRCPRLASGFHQVSLYADGLAPADWFSLRQAVADWSLAMGDSDLV